MRRWAFGVLCVLACCRTLCAQPPSPPGGPGFGPGPMGPDKLMLLDQVSVQEELKLTDKQIKQVEVRARKQRETLDRLREQDPADAQKKMSKQSKANDAALAKLLTAEQFERLSQIGLQRRGPRAWNDAAFAKALALTPQQKTKLEEIQETAQEEARAVFSQLGGAPGRGGPRPAGPGGVNGNRPGGDNHPDGPGGVPPDEDRPARNRLPGGQNNGGQGPAVPGGFPRRGGPNGQGGPDGPPSPEQQAARAEAFQKLEAMRQATDEKLLRVLDETQKAKWQSMLGAPFAGKIEGPGFGPPGNRPRGERPDGRGPRGENGEARERFRPNDGAGPNGPAGGN